MPENIKMPIIAHLSIVNRYLPVYIDVLNLSEIFYKEAIVSGTEEHKQFMHEQIEHQKTLLALSKKNAGGCVIFFNEEELDFIHDLFNRTANYYLLSHKLLNDQVQLLKDEFVRSTGHSKDNKLTDSDVIAIRFFELHVTARNYLSYKAGIFKELVDLINTVYGMVKPEDGGDASSK
ncbi:hypothetical protein [uncultured Dialister sp.]|jgi:hypothetical protein|uniref:hypothetical protein n=1 Tax=uncultured Dialister sp. TaxID=278064 RepID=UPI0025D077F2|nr:hypothetical protein [uncultured Dialister sp.]